MNFIRLFGINVAPVIKSAKLSYSTALTGTWCVVSYMLGSPLLRDHLIFIDVFEKEVIFFDPEIYVLNRRQRIIQENNYILIHIRVRASRFCIIIKSIDDFSTPPLQYLHN